MITLNLRALRRSSQFASTVIALAALALFQIHAASTVAAVLASATITTSQTSAPYTYSLVLHNTGNLPLDTFWFSWLDSPDRSFMSVAPSGVQSPGSWFGLTSHLGAGDGYGIEWYSLGNDLAADGTLSGFQFVSTESPAQLAGTVAVPGLGNLPVTTAFVYSGGAFSPNGAEITAQVVPEPASLILGVLGSLSAWFAWRRAARPA